MVQGVMATGDDDDDNVDTTKDQDDVIESQEPEVEPLRTLPSPYVPSASEIAEHEIDHIPPRPMWCRFCLEGHGREDAHTSSGSARSTPVISMDYMFLSRRGLFTRSEWEPQAGENSAKVLVIRDSKSRALF